MKWMFRLYLLVVLCLAAFPVAARQLKPEEVLYSSGDTLYLANVVTGTTTSLPYIKVTSYSGWLWSPNGRYLLGNFSYSSLGEKLIRIYDVDNQRWIQTIKVDVEISYIVWSPDSTRIAFVKPVKYDSLQNDGQLWLFDLQTGQQRMLYQTQFNGDRALTDTGIEDMWWSPDSQFLLFEKYVSKMGNTDTALNLISVDGKTSKQMSRPWRAGFKPTWSPDSKWFLLNLPDTLYFPVDPNDFGDVLVYGINDAIYSITNTPSVLELNLRWSADGKYIQFETDKQLVSVELQKVIENPKNFEQHLSPLPPKLKHFGDADFPSPDGQWIAYLVGKADNTIDLYTVQPDGSHDSKLAETVIFLDGDLHDTSNHPP